MYRNRYKTLSPEQRVLRSSKSNAKTCGTEFSLTLNDIVIPTHCPVFGTELQFSGNRDDTPSIDRINPKGGYVKGNVAVISMRANRLKNNGSIEDFEKIIDYMKRYEG